MAILVAQRRLRIILIRLSAVPGLQHILPPTTILGLLTIAHTTLQPQARTSTQPPLHLMVTRQLHRLEPRRRQSSLVTGLMHRHLEGRQRHTADNRKRQLGAVMMGQGMRMVHQARNHVSNTGLGKRRCVRSLSSSVVVSGRCPQQETHHGDDGDAVLEAHNDARRLDL